VNTPDIEMWAFPMEMDRWGAGGALVKMEGVPSGGNSTIIYFSVKTVHSSKARVIALVERYIVKNGL